MDDTKGLKILSDVLGWDDQQSRMEFAWLKMMAAIKYDDYRDFLPGMRFLENLSAWLQQFSSLDDRREAYQLLRKRLIYVSPPEMQRLVELFYPCEIERRLIRIVASRKGIPLYQVRVNHEARSDLERLRRRTLILGLSDGARIDILRHSTVGVLGNEQFAVQTQLDHIKWQSLLNDLRDAQKDDPNVAFEVVFLVDDFMGTGSSYLRHDKEKGEWKGKLCKFLQSIESAKAHKVDVFAPNWQLCVHHYLATEEAASLVAQKEAAAIADGAVSLTQPSFYSFGATISKDVMISKANPEHGRLIELATRHYNSKIESKHTKVGGVEHIGLGYGGCALPLVLHHNTPNNSLALIWADVKAGKDKNGNSEPEMRPLFRRRQRHSEAV